MLRQTILIALCVLIIMPLTGCGHKGSLKTPSQIELDEAKKAKKEAKRQRETAPEAQEE